MMDSIVLWLLQLIETIGYPGIALAMFLESFFAPIPSEAIVPL
jgi:membrane protein DedA with SNARE-associated domain